MNSEFSMDIGDNCTNTDAAFEEGLMRQGFSLTAPKLKAKRMNNDMFELHGGRVIRSTGRKDRHSKVYTARGTRDRRVRLSPQTAISFYDVQDRLGYDRPSKAIDWLMQEAKSAIDALIEPPPPPIDAADTQNVENSNDDYPVSGFGFAATPSSAEFQSNPVEVFDANLEIARLQRILSWNYNFSGGAPPLICPDPTELGHSYVFSDREPLQSRICSPFPGAGYNSSADLLNFDGAAKFEEDETDFIPDSCNSSFLRIE